MVIIFYIFVYYKIKKKVSIFWCFCKFKIKLLNGKKINTIKRKNESTNLFDKSFILPYIQVQKIAEYVSLKFWSSS